MRRHFTLVLKGHIALDRIQFPKGTSGAQVDAFARAPLWQAGLDFDHGTGHGIGSFLCVHEGPARIAKSGTVPLEPGHDPLQRARLLQNRRLRHPHRNLVTVIEVDAPPGGERPLLGFENLTRVPLDRKLIGRAMLDESEQMWIDAYHALVRADLDEMLDGSAHRWMLAATGPLPDRASHLRQDRPLSIVTEPAQLVLGL